VRSRLICSTVLVWLCCGVIIAHAQDQPTFSRRVVGHVKDREDRPILEARVCAHPHGAWAGLIPCGVSKTDGSFTLDFWSTGTYTISAEKKSEGFPDANDGLYGCFFGLLSIITVDESSELIPVEVGVGPKAGRVSFKIVDDESGELIESGVVKVCRSDNLKICTSMSMAFTYGKYHLLTPEVAFTIRFELPAGKGQNFEERTAIDEWGGPVETLYVELGTRKEMTIRLRRVQVKRQ
jgi:hypothetical protein